MSRLLEADELIDLTDLPVWEDTVSCSSRSAHDCTVEAVYRSTARHPCPDPVRTVFWCLARYQKYQLWSQQDLNCIHCKRDVTTCWRVQAL